MSLAWAYMLDLMFRVNLDLAQILPGLQSLDFSFDESLKEKFIAAIHSYWPNMDPGKLQPDYVGIRPKTQSAHQTMQDFSILGPSDHGVSRFNYSSRH